MDVTLQKTGATVVINALDRKHAKHAKHADSSGTDRNGGCRRKRAWRGLRARGDETSKTLGSLTRFGVRRFIAALDCFRTGDRREGLTPKRWKKLPHQSIRCVLPALGGMRVDFARGDWPAGRESGRFHSAGTSRRIELRRLGSPGCCSGSPGRSCCGSPTGSSWRCCSSSRRGSPGSSPWTAHRHRLYHGAAEMPTRHARCPGEGYQGGCPRCNSPSSISAAQPMSFQGRQFAAEPPSAAAVQGHVPAIDAAAEEFHAHERVRLIYGLGLDGSSASRSCRNAHDREQSRSAVRRSFRPIRPCRPCNARTLWREAFP